MRPYEQITIEAQADPQDFGQKGPDWQPVCHVHATIEEGAGRISRSGQQEQPVNDADITIRYQRDVHTSWQKKVPLRIKATNGDIFGIVSCNHIRGTRVEWLQLGCKR